MLRACCCSSAARCSPHTKCGGAVCFLWHLLASSCMSSAVCCTVSVACVACGLQFSARCLPSDVFCLVLCCLVVCCPLHAVCCLFHVVCGLLHAACCMLPCALHVVVVRCMLLQVWRMLHVARFGLHVICCSLHIARCMPHVVWKLSVGSCVSLVAFSPSHVACRLSHFPRCRLHVVNCLLHIFQWSSSALLSVGSCLRAPSLLHVARGLLPAACLSSPVAWRALPVACPMSHLVTVHVRRCASSVACCMTHVPC